jgi:hypothetical protein
METVNRCLCCAMPIVADTLCERCLILVSEVVLAERGVVVAKLWDVSAEFERNRSKLRRQVEGPRFVPNTAVGTALGLVRMGKIDDGLCIGALWVAMQRIHAGSASHPGKCLLILPRSTMKA